jgi:hypothetical protein
MNGSSLPNDLAAVGAVGTVTITSIPVEVYFGLESGTGSILLESGGYLLLE